MQKCKIRQINVQVLKFCVTAEVGGRDIRQVVVDDNPGGVIREHRTADLQSGSIQTMHAYIKLFFENELGVKSQTQ